MRRSHPTALLIDLTGWQEEPSELLAFARQVHAAGRPVALVADPAPADLPVIEAADLAGRKPTREFFASACAAVGTAPSECLFVDDQDWNVRGARAAGLSAYRWSGADDLPYLRAALALD